MSMTRRSIVRRAQRPHILMVALTAAAIILPLRATGAQDGNLGPRPLRAGLSAVVASPPHAQAPTVAPEDGTDLAMITVGGSALVVGLTVGQDGGRISAIGGGLLLIVGLLRSLR